MKPACSSSSMPGNIDSDQFPEGLRVLVVDDDPTCLTILEKMLQNCLYKVTTCNRAKVALELLRENKNGYDIVMSDVHMPDMDGFKLLEHVGLEIDLPVIMISADDGKKVVMRGILNGACDYLIKPIRMETLKNIWQHVVRKKKHERKDKDIEPSGGVEDGEQQQNPSQDVEYLSSVNEENFQSSKKRMDEDISTLKKPRVVWSMELHQQFVGAVNHLGVDRAIPKKILQLMNVPGLTRENIASHLQKYRLYVRRVNADSQHQSGTNTSVLTSPQTAFGEMSSFSGLDMQALASSGQLSGQNLATLHAGAFSRPTTTSALSMQATDKRNLFSFEAPNLRVWSSQQDPSNSCKQVSLLQEIPTNVEPKQLTNLHSNQSFLGINGSSQVNHSCSPFMQMTQPQPRGLFLNQSNDSQVPILHSPNGQTLLSNDIPSVWTLKGVERGSTYSHVSQSPSIGNLSMKQRLELPRTTFPIMGDPGMQSLSPKPVFQGETNIETKGARNFCPEYDIVNGLHASQQNGRSNLHASQQLAFKGHSGQQDFSSTTKSGEYKNVPVNKGYICVGEGQNNTSSMGPENPVSTDTSRVVKSESLIDPDCQSNQFSESFGHEDLMSVLLKQEEEVIHVDNDFGFDGYSTNNLSS